MKTVIINANTDLGLDIDGCDEGPKIISQHFKNDKRIEKIINIDKPNIIKSKDDLDLAKNIDGVNNFNEKLYKKVINIHNEDYFPIIVGGDHSLSIASSLAAIKNEDVGIIWIDSHIDYNTFQTTITGNIHGLPLATINDLNPTLSKFHQGNYYNPANTVIVGYRAHEANREQELGNINKMNVKVFTTDDLKHIGIKEVITSAFDIASRGKKKVHISFDLDVIDPLVAPGVSIKEENGLFEEEITSIFEEILHHKDIIKSFDIVEFNPLNDINHQTEKIAVNIIDKIINSKYK